MIRKAKLKALIMYVSCDRVVKRFTISNVYIAVVHFHFIFGGTFRTEIQNIPAKCFFFIFLQIYIKGPLLKFVAHIPRDQFDPP